MNESGKPRSHPDIIREILSVTKEPQSTQGIIRQVGINYVTLIRYASVLVGSGNLKQTGGSRVRYVTTSKGLEFLTSLDNSANGLEEFNKLW
jgi:predicted transcriptional regulator